MYIPVETGTHHRVEPDPTNIGGTLWWMSSENGRENSPLNPPGVEFRTWRRWSVPTNIMTPVPKSNITGCHSKRNLKVKGVPTLQGIKCLIASSQTVIIVTHSNYISRESNLVTMIPQPSPAMEKKWTNLQFSQLSLPWNKKHLRMHTVLFFQWYGLVKKI